ncbi:caspase family protein [Actinomadura sp. WMMA1423]|uniref:caspase family protein n=1 Tax=Actinomadura sp. WMMA1423 TaxID=2591108 RepID=UPI0011472DF9|nr:caspase family protein [Actinomadura sp. WMMA1423]
MTELFYSSTSQQEEQGGLHVLAIGAGHYPHLGSPGTVDVFGHLEELTSPAVSARWFAERLRDSPSAEWAVPPKSIDLLTSEPGQETFTTKRAQIQQAFDQWHQRCRSHPANIGLFYFCGHGFQHDNHLLLTSDFAESVHNRFAGSFDFDNTRRALAHNGPVTQCFIIDACRSPLPTSEARQQARFSTPLLASFSVRRKACQAGLTLRVSLGEEGAADRYKASAFTKAVTKALQGHAAELDGETGRWVVSNQSIGTAIGAILQETVGNDVTAPPVAIEHDGRYHIFRRLNSPPTGTLELSCDPGMAQARARLSYEPLPGGGDQRVTRRKASAMPWRVPIQAGHHKVDARFPDGDYTDASDMVFAVPPVCQKKLWVAR